MSTTAIKRPTDEFLLKFTAPAHERFSLLHRVWHYRGDLTQRGDDSIRSAIGDDAWEHYHWDLVVSNGTMMVVIPKWKHPRGVERQWGGPGAEYSWAMSMAGERHPEVVPAPKRILRKVRATDLELIKQLPGLEIVHVPKVYFFTHSSARKGAKRGSKRAPRDCAYFRFDGGYGLSFFPREEAPATE